MTQRKTVNRQKTTNRGAIRRSPGKRFRLLPRLPRINFKQLFSSVLKLSLAFGLAAAAVAIWPHLNRPVSEVEFAGSLERVDTQALREQVELTVKKGLLTLDIDELDARLEGVDWVYAAEIKKIWPQRLSIRVEEEQPVARWGELGYLTASGKMVASPAREELTHLPHFDVQVANPGEALELFYGLNAAMMTNGMALQDLRQSQFGSWSMVMENGSEIVLGKNELIARIRRAMGAWQRLSPAHLDELEAVDARYPNGVAVKYREEIVQQQKQLNGGWET